MKKSSKKLTLITTLCFSFVSFIQASDIITSKDIIVKHGVPFLKKTNKPFTGLLTKYWHNTETIQAQANFKNGKQDGLDVRYSANGAKKFEGTFKNGKEEGLAIAYYESGVKKQEITYKNGKLEGLAITYYESGGVKSKGTYINGTYINGESGGVKSKGTYKNGNSTVSNAFISTIGKILGIVILLLLIKGIKILYSRVKS